MATSTQKVIYGVHYMQINSDFYKVTQVKPNVWAIEDVVSSEHTICYLICGASKALLFDTGLGISPVSPVVKELTDLPILVILSHWHFDHCGAASEFQDIIGWHSTAMEGISQKGTNEKSIEALVGTKFVDSIKPQTLEVLPFPHIRLLKSEQSFDIGGYTFQVVHTPGHTEDSICLYEASQKWLLTGDTAYPAPIYLQFSDSNVKSYGKSIQRLKELEVSDIFPGHNEIHAGANILSEIQNLLGDNDYKAIVYPALEIKT